MASTWRRYTAYEQSDTANRQNNEVISNVEPPKANRIRSNDDENTCQLLSLASESNLRPLCAGSEPQRRSAHARCTHKHEFSVIRIAARKAVACVCGAGNERRGRLMRHCCCTSRANQPMAKCERSELTSCRPASSRRCTCQTKTENEEDENANSGR